jgi:hypothetical protein
MIVPSHRFGGRRLRERLGAVGAAVALAVQLVVVFAPMPQAGDAGGLVALVSPHIACEPLGPAQRKPHHGPAPAGHECPICQILAQTGACLSPTVVAEVMPQSWAQAAPTTLPETDRPVRPAPSQAQPRAPPPLA